MPNCDVHRNDDFVRPAILLLGDSNPPVMASVFYLLRLVRPSKRRSIRIAHMAAVALAAFETVAGSAWLFVTFAACLD
jgi:hypothetical protein